eukprot:8296825-Pyramimonas_sp.AAC.2
MAVLGSWPDGEAGDAEAQAITYVKDRLPHCLTNRCADARGLEIRSHGYSFVYICFDLRRPVMQNDMGGRMGQGIPARLQLVESVLSPQQLASKQAKSEEEGEAEQEKEEETGGGRG